MLFRSAGFADWIVEFKRYSTQNSRQNRSKTKLVCESAVTRAHWSCSLRVMGSCPKLAISILRKVWLSLSYLTHSPLLYWILWLVPSRLSLSLSNGAWGVMAKRKASERDFLLFPFPSPPAPAARVTWWRLGTTTSSPGLFPPHPFFEGKALGTRLWGRVSWILNNPLFRFLIFHSHLIRRTQ